MEPLARVLGLKDTPARVEFGVALSGGVVPSEAVGAAKYSVALLRRHRGGSGFNRARVATLVRRYDVFARGNGASVDY